MAPKKLTAEYEKRFENESLIEFLIKRDSFAKLKQLLDAESVRLEKLQKAYRRKALDFGFVTLFEDLPEMLGQVKKDVDTFLGLEKISSPQLMPYHFLNWPTSYLSVLFTLLGLVVMAAGLLLRHYYRNSWPVFILGAGALFLGYKTISRVAVYGSKVASGYSYNPLTQTIIVPSKSISYGRHAELAHVLAHEYAHHLENVFKFGGAVSHKLDIFKEGFAIGIQRHVAHMYALKEGNDAFLYWILDEDVGAMQGVYVWVSKKLGVPFARRPKWLKTSRRPFEPMVGLKSFVNVPSAHALGCVLFLLFEDKYGKNIYGDILRRKFEFTR